MSERTKGGNVILEQVLVPRTVEPGEPFEVEAKVSNGAGIINPWDKDHCRKPGATGPDGASGYSIEVVFEVDGETRVSGPTCIRKTAFGKRTNTYSKTFTAPSYGGSVDVEAYVRLPGSGKETGKMSQTVTVSSDDVEETDPPADDDDTGDGNDNDGDDDNGGNNPLAGIFPFLFPDGGGGGGLNALVGVLVLLAIAWMLDSGSDIAG